MQIDFKTYCDPDTERDIRVFDRFSKKNLQVYNYSNITILPSCNSVAIDCDGEIVQEDGTIINGVNSNVNYPYLIDNICTHTTESKIENTPIVYLGTIINCWGHYFTDGFSKMWFFFTDEWEQISKGNVKVCFVSPYRKLKEAPAPWLELIRLLGLNITPQPINEYCKYKSVYVPDNSIYMYQRHRVYTKEYKQIVERLLMPVIPYNYGNFEKIYLSRKNWINGNADFGENAIERLFNKVGYVSICPEKYSIKEQLAIFKTAKSVVSTSGSLALNVIFCNNGIELIELRKGMGSPDYQLMINQLKNHRITFIDCHLTLFVDENVALGPFFLYINDNLVRFFRDKYNLIVKNNFNIKQYLEYCRLCFAKENFYKRHRPYNEYSDFYYKKLTEEILSHKNWKRRVYDFFDTVGMSKIKHFLKRLYYNIAR